MSYFLNGPQAEALLAALKQQYRIYAPKRFPKAGRYSDTDIVRYAEIDRVSDIVFDRRSDFPAKEVLHPIQETIFYFTEDEWRASKAPVKPALVFARPCDINAQRVQERIFLQNGGYADLYAARRRELVQFVLMDCHGGEDTCFCVSMGQNRTEDYCMAVCDTPDGLKVSVKDERFLPYFTGAQPVDFTPAFVEQNELTVQPPEIRSPEVLLQLKQHPMWQEYNKRCISCGACTVACSTCTCFTTRDLCYTENGQAGERRRVSASCQIEGFTTVAGGGSYRNTAGDRMRYKVLHKFHDYKARFGDEHMCMGCGRCTSRCPQAISITATVEKMNRAIAEIEARPAKEGE